MCRRRSVSSSLNVATRFTATLNTHTRVNHSNLAERHHDLQHVLQRVKSECVRRFTSTSAQLCTVPFTLVHVGKYKTEDKLKVQTIHKLNTPPPQKQNLKYTNTKQPWFSRLIRHLTRKWGLFYTLPSPHGARHTTYRGKTCTNDDSNSGTECLSKK